MISRGKRTIILALAVTLSAFPCIATSYAPVSMKKLLAEADAVAFVKITGGSVEGFEKVVYVSEVVESIKGMARGDRVYFGPYVGNAVGGEYLLFLRRSDRTVGSLCEGKCGSSLAVEESATFYEVMFVGFGSMAVDFTCPFETCTYCVDVPVSHVPVPSSVRASPYEDPRSRASEHAWIKKTDLIAYLRTLVGDPSVKPAH